MAWSLWTLQLALCGRKSRLFRNSRIPKPVSLRGSRSSEEITGSSAIAGTMSRSLKSEMENRVGVYWLEATDCQAGR